MRAGIISVVYLLCRVLGLDLYTSVLSGTSPSGGPIGSLDVELAFAYIFVHFAFVLAVPILILAAGLLALFERIVRSQITP